MLYIKNKRIFIEVIFSTLLSIILVSALIIDFLDERSVAYLSIFSWQVFLISELKILGLIFMGLIYLLFLIFPIVNFISDIVRNKKVLTLNSLIHLFMVLIIIIHMVSLVKICYEALRIISIMQYVK